MAALDPNRVAFIVVHCSASKPSLAVDAKMINRWHRQQGWLKIGYHFVIKRDGTVEKGRELTEVGAHVEGYNSVSVGICMAGGLNERTGRAENNFTLDQYAALALLVRDMQSTFPHAETLGHRDMPNVAKDCPCFDVRKWMKDTKV
jgi:N-acetylmuramoyl-L-alanine amidase